ncbi:ribose-phosphate pyrophosphokinase 5 [Pochonia chlamydosporia 170]|uniref:Ribose-phosphate pyrophosphokinase 5 n=1 Tax=Pochonia chlamydosporia 170 TaxID=1380566 RepID=A0A179G7Y1_METCM|nr:ribose-phosphate pyrophosphokinase 5 [Pochonia chlamydosporia 170]OAQ73279.2 ribose-phosphate pyrophosphokinase 5 [Pochonia chlamydosporia 170]
MVRNIVLLGGNSHPQLTENVSNILGIPSCDRILSKFSGGESRCEIKDSVRGKDVYIVQSGSGHVNDNLIDLCIMISACKTGSAKRVTAVVPLFPYSRQPDWPYNKAGAPLSRSSEAPRKDYTFESVPATPRPGGPRSHGLSNGAFSLSDKLQKTTISETNGTDYFPKRSDTLSSVGSNGRGHTAENSISSQRSFTTHDYENPNSVAATFQAKPGYKQWVAQAGTLVADLLTCAGADHIITMDLHDPQYQGFFDIPVDNLYGKPLIQSYIQKHIPGYGEAVIVSPDAGGAKRATAIADSLKMDFALIHKERRPIKFTEQRNASMMLVGDIANRVCILVDDLGDTANTITRAAKLLKKEGATKVYALLTHGVFSGDAIPRLNASAIDKIIVTNSVPQEEHRRLCPKLEVLDVSPIFAEAIRRVHHGESISRLFQYD